MASTRLFLILVVTLSSLPGCAIPSVRPPSPAAKLLPQDLERQPIPPGESYYIIVFGAESCPKIPRLTHTWATAVKVVEQGPGKSPIIEKSTISWMPSSLKIHPWCFRVETGVNLTLEQTLQHVCEQGERISMWGPYQVRPGVYRKFLIQKEFVESGKLGYQCIDTVGEASWSGTGADCIHAISDSDALYDRDHYPLHRFGSEGSEYLVKQLFTRDMLLPPYHTHDWLIAAMRLNRWTIERCSYNGPGAPTPLTR
jgi:hypothetical protein